MWELGVRNSQLRDWASQFARASEPGFTMLRVAILAPHNKNPNAFPFLAVDHGVGEALQYMNSPHFVSRRTEAWKLNQ